MLLGRRIAIISLNNQYISWAKGIGVAALAAVIAIPLSGLGAAGVIASMDTGALGVIAAGAIGGTVDYSLQRLEIPYNPTHHPIYLIIYSKYEGLLWFIHFSILMNINK